MSELNEGLVLGDNLSQGSLYLPHHHSKNLGPQGTSIFTVWVDPSLIGRTPDIGLWVFFIHSFNKHTLASLVCWALGGGTEDTTCPHI